LFRRVFDQVIAVRESAERIGRYVRDVPSQRGMRLEWRRASRADNGRRDLNGLAAQRSEHEVMADVMVSSIGAVEQRAALTTGAPESPLSPAEHVLALWR